ncbi:MAG: acetylornithine deacetylase, partial [Bacteroidota bacterium]
MKPIRILPFLLLLGYSTSYSQINQTKLNSTAEKFALNSWDLFYELLSIPNDAHYPEDIMKNVKWCENEFQARGFSTKRLKTETVPLVLAEYPISEAKETILVYLQIDGQPVDHTRWFQDDPWKPELKQKDKDGEWEIIAWDQIKKNYHPDMRVFARSTSDAKGPVAMFLTAWDAMNSLEKQPPYNLKIIMDFEEELGSPHLPAAVEKYSEELASDCLVIF